MKVSNKDSQNLSGWYHDYIIIFQNILKVFDLYEELWELDDSTSLEHRLRNAKYSNSYPKPVGIDSNVKSCVTRRSGGW